MIRINLLPQRKARKADKAQQQMAVGLAVVIGAAAVLFVFVHKPLQEEVDQMEGRNKQQNSKLAERRKKVKDVKNLKKAFENAQEQAAAISRLDAARATPAWLLHELSTILTKDKSPTMSKAMSERVQNDPNRSWTQGWDPKHVWITSFEEKKGKFTLKGGAQSDSDMTQLSLRMQASMYFEDVVPMTGSEKKEGRGGVSYYEFVISGMVVY